MFFFALLSRDFEQIFGQIVSIRVKTLSNTNLVASRHIKREKRSLPVDFRRSKTWGGVGGYSPIKVTGVLIELFRSLNLWIGTA